jgi:hypothetical protein
MSYTLHETLRQIDPYVKLNDGASIRTVEQVLFAADPSDPTEYAMFVDSVGRLMIYQLNETGYVMRPPVFIEEKISINSQSNRKEKAHMA